MSILNVAEVVFEKIQEDGSVEKIDIFNADASPENDSPQRSKRKKAEALKPDSRKTLVDKKKMLCAVE